MACQTKATNNFSTCAALRQQFMQKAVTTAITHKHVDECNSCKSLYLQLYMLYLYFSVSCEFHGTKMKEQNWRDKYVHWVTQDKFVWGANRAQSTQMHALLILLLWALFSQHKPRDVDCLFSRTSRLGNRLADIARVLSSEKKQLVLCEQIFSIHSLTSSSCVWQVKVENLLTDQK